MFTLLLLFAITPDEAYNSKIGELNKKCEAILSKAIAEEASKEFSKDKVTKLYDLYSDYSAFVKSGVVPARLLKHYDAKKAEIYNEILTEYAGSTQLARFKDRLNKQISIRDVLPTAEQIDSIGHTPLTISQQAKASKIYDKMKSFEGKLVMLEFDVANRIFLVGDGAHIKISFDALTMYFTAPPQSIIKKFADDDIKVSLQMVGKFHIGKKDDPGIGQSYLGFGNEFLSRFCEKGTMYFIYDYETILIVNGEKITLTQTKDVQE